MTSQNGLPTIKTYTGQQFSYESPTADMIRIEDIGHALSMICRFGGQAREFYSVAQHSLLVAELAPQEFAFDALLHDASEAYCGDMVRPLKNLLPGYREIEEKIHRAIA